MKQALIYFVKLSIIFMALLSSVNVQAKEPILIVTDPWPPFAINSDGDIKGTDVEIIKAVFAQMDIPITINFFPWKRCLAMVRNQKADAILDVSITPERKSWLFFPEEPVSEGVTVFFTKKEKEIPFNGLEDLNSLRAGAILGYSYCDEIDRAPFMKSAMRVGWLEQNFKKLLTNRIDFLIEVESVGFYMAKKMNISDRIKIIPNAYYCQGGNYLAFSKKPGFQQLAEKFGQSLQKFKTTKKYHKILETYGLKGSMASKK